MHPHHSGAPNQPGPISTPQGPPPQQMPPQPHQLPLPPHPMFPGPFPRYFLVKKFEAKFIF